MGIKIDSKESLMHKTDYFEEKLFEIKDEEDFIKLFQSGEIVNQGNGILSLLEQMKVEKDMFVDMLYNSPLNGTARDSIRRKVDNWINGRTRIKRENLFEIAILFDMDIDAAEHFFCEVIAEKWIHYRNVNDVIFYFSIVNKYTLNDVNWLINGVKKIGVKRYHTFLTSFVKDNIGGFQKEKSRKPEEVLEFIEQNIMLFSESKNTLKRCITKVLSTDNNYIKANKKFNLKKWANLLVQSEIGLDDEKAVKRARSLMNQLNKYMKSILEIPRDLFLKCLLISGANDIDTVNIILDECGFCKLYARNQYDMIIMESIIDSIDGYAYDKFIELNEVWSKYIILEDK